MSEVVFTYQPGEIEHSGDVAREVDAVESFGGRLIKEETVQEGPYDLCCQLTVAFPSQEKLDIFRQEIGWF